MISRLHEINSVLPDVIYHTMLIRESPRPHPCPQTFQWFGFSNSYKRIAKNRFH